MHAAEELRENINQFEKHQDRGGICRSNKFKDNEQTARGVTHGIPLCLFSFDPLILFTPLFRVKDSSNTPAE